MLEGILPLVVCIDEDEGGFAARCDRFGDHAWRGKTPENALEALAEDVRGLVELYWAHRGRAGTDPSG